MKSECHLAALISSMCTTFDLGKPCDFPLLTSSFLPLSRSMRLVSAALLALRALLSLRRASGAVARCSTVSPSCLFVALVGCALGGSPSFALRRSCSALRAAETTPEDAARCRGQPAAVGAWHRLRRARLLTSRGNGGTGCGLPHRCAAAAAARRGLRLPRPLPSLYHVYDTTNKCSFLVYNAEISRGLLICAAACDTITLRGCRPARNTADNTPTWCIQT